MMKFRDFVIGLLIITAIGCGFSEPFRKMILDYAVKGTFDNAGKLFNYLGDKIKNVKLESSVVKIDAKLESLNSVNKHIVVEGSISNTIWLKQFCKAWLFGGSEINIYNATPDFYSLNLEIDFSKVKVKKGSKYIVPIDAIKWVINVSVKEQKHSIVNDKFYNVAKIVPLFVSVSIIRKFKPLFIQKYQLASSVRLVEDGEVIGLILPDFDSVLVEMPDGFNALPSDFKPTFKEFSTMYYPSDDSTYEENIEFNVAPTLMLKSILTNS